MEGLTVGFVPCVTTSCPFVRLSTEWPSLSERSLILQVANSSGINEAYNFVNGCITVVLAMLCHGTPFLSHRNISSLIESICK
jgi:hypothetical protein